MESIETLVADAKMKGASTLSREECATVYALARMADDGVVSPGFAVMKIVSIFETSPSSQS